MSNTRALNIDLNFGHSRLLVSIFFLTFIIINELDQDWRIKHYLLTDSVLKHKEFKTWTLKGFVVLFFLQTLQAALVLFMAIIVVLMSNDEYDALNNSLSILVINNLFEMASKHFITEFR